MRLCFISSEVFPFSKTGGLADVSGALPKALAKKGVDVCVFTPKYKSVNKFEPKELYRTSLKVGSREEEYILYEYKNSNNHLTYYFIGNDHYFNRNNLYGEGSQDYIDNAERFSLFSYAVLDILKKMRFQPDIVHTNDWQTALVDIYLKLYYKSDDFFKNSNIMLTIHNIGYQGIFNKNKMQTLNLPWGIFNIDGVEFYNQINLLKGGIIFADTVTTVSKTYSQEIQTKEYGARLDGVLRKFSNKLTGIVNGLDYDVWNPKTDQFIEFPYTEKNISGKYENKKALQKELKLGYKNVPLFGMVSRLASQKGVDIATTAIENILKEHMDAEFVILGTGDKELEKKLEETAKKYKEKIAVVIGFDEGLAHRIYAGSDFFLMPSKYEPCGLGQMIAYRYGAVPIVRATGGLKDTVEDYDNINQKGSGFVFEKYDSSELLKTILKAMALFSKKNEMESLAKKVMRFDYSWDNQASEYVKLYENIKNG